MTNSTDSERAVLAELAELADSIVREMHSVLTSKWDRDCLRAKALNALYQAAALRASDGNAGKAWQTMEAAPRDGSPIMLTGVTAGGRRWFMDGEVYAKGWIGGSAVGRTPNYWQRLPEFPSSSLSRPLPKGGAETRHPECDCQQPEEINGVRLISNSCPIHNENPDPRPPWPEASPVPSSGVPQALDAISRAADALWDARNALESNARPSSGEDRCKLCDSGAVEPSADRGPGNYQTDGGE